jgi:hypothetical protein
MQDWKPRGNKRSPVKQEPVDQSSEFSVQAPSIRRALVLDFLEHKLATGAFYFWFGQDVGIGPESFNPGPEVNTDTADMGPAPYRHD